MKVECLTHCPQAQHPAPPLHRRVGLGERPPQGRWVAPVCMHKRVSRTMTLFPQFEAKDWAYFPPSAVSTAGTRQAVRHCLCLCAFEGFKGLLALPLLPLYMCARRVPLYFRVFRVECKHAALGIRVP